MQTLSDGYLSASSEQSKLPMELDAGGGCLLGLLKTQKFLELMFIL